MAEEEPTITTVTTDDKPLFEVSKQERQMEQKMVKVISRMHENVQNRFKCLHVWSDERSKINDLFEKEVRELADKFEQRKLPILEKRDQVLGTGSTEGMQEMVTKFEESHTRLETEVAGIVKTDDEKEADAEEEKAHTPTDVSHLVDKTGVPDFWKVAIQNHAMLQTIITEKDKAVMENLVSLKATQSKNPQPVLAVEMTFSENEYFTNTTLSFKACADQDTSQTVEIQGCTIDWKEGQDVTKKKVKKTQKNKKTGEKRVIVKTMPQDSFFNMFESKKEPEGIHDRDDDDVDSDDDKIMQQLEEAHDVANDLYDLYTTDALEFYLGFGPEIDGLMGEDDDDSEGDDSDGEAKPKKGKKKGPGGEGQGAVGPDGKPEDCKQQ